jgi:hypothetical protein
LLFLMSVGAAMDGRYVQAAAGGSLGTFIIVAGHYRRHRSTSAEGLRVSAITPRRTEETHPEGRA